MVPTLTAFRRVRSSGGTFAPERVPDRGMGGGTWLTGGGEGRKVAASGAKGFLRGAPTASRGRSSAKASEWRDSSGGTSTRWT